MQDLKHFSFALPLLAALLLASAASAGLPSGLYADFDTSMGSFTARLDYAEAPLTCANFVGLAEGSQHWVDPQTGSIRSDPLYDGLLFHRVIDGFMIQGGDPLGTGRGGPGYAFPDEFTSLTHSGPGILSMANSGPDSNGSQFFITLTNTYWLNGKHSVFGEVVDGMNVVSNIGAVATDENDRPLANVVINHIGILRVGSAAQAFDPQGQPLPKVFPLPLSISGTDTGAVVSVVASNRCKDAIYQKATLDSWVAWSGVETNYSQAGGETRLYPAATNQPAQFFQGVRIFHPLATTNEVAGHTLTLSYSSSYTIVLQPAAGGGGSCSLNDNPGSISDWGFDDAYCGFYFKTSLMWPLSLDFVYTTPTSGNFDGFYHYYHQDGGYWEWVPMSGTFTDTPPPR